MITSQVDPTFLTEDIEEFKFRFREGGEVLPDEVAWQTFHQLRMQVDKVPMDLRIASRTWLVEHNLLDKKKLPPITPEETLKSFGARFILGTMQYNIKHYKYIVLVIKQNGSDLSSRVFLRLLDLLITFIDKVSSNYTNKVLVMQNRCIIKIVEEDEPIILQSHFKAEEVGYRIVENIHDI